MNRMNCTLIPANECAMLLYSTPLRAVTASSFTVYGMLKPPPAARGLRPAAGSTRRRLEHAPQTFLVAACIPAPVQIAQRIVDRLCDRPAMPRR